MTLCTKLWGPVAPPKLFSIFFHILQVCFYYQNEQNEGVSRRKIPFLFLVNHPNVYAHTNIDKNFQLHGLVVFIFYKGRPVGVQGGFHGTLQDYLINASADYYFIFYFFIFYFFIFIFIFIFFVPKEAYPGG